MSRTSRQTVFGPILIVVGLLMLLAQAGVPAYTHLWPLILIAVGVGMLLRYLQARQDSGLVFTGTLLVLIGGLFQADQWFRLYMSDHWPFFPLAVGLSLLAMALADDDRRDALVPAGILIGLGVVFYFFSFGFFQWLVRGIVRLLAIVLRVAVPVGLIGLGAWLLLGRRGGLGEDRADFPEKIEPPLPGGAMTYPPSGTPTAGGWGSKPGSPMPLPRPAGEVDSAGAAGATDPGTSPAADPGADVAADPGTDVGGDPGADPGADAATDPWAGVEPHPDPGADPSVRREAETDTGGEEAAADSGADSGEGSGSRDGSSSDADPGPTRRSPDDPS